MHIKTYHTLSSNSKLQISIALLRLSRAANIMIMKGFCNLLFNQTSGVWLCCNPLLKSWDTLSHGILEAWFLDHMTATKNFWFLRRNSSQEVVIVKGLGGLKSHKFLLRSCQVYAGEYVHGAIDGGGQLHSKRSKLTSISTRHTRRYNEKQQPIAIVV